MAAVEKTPSIATFGRACPPGTSFVGRLFFGKIQQIAFGKLREAKKICLILTRVSRSDCNGAGVADLAVGQDDMPLVAPGCLTKAAFAGPFDRQSRRIAKLIARAHRRMPRERVRRP